MKISCRRSCASLAVLFLVCGLSSESVWAIPVDTKMLDITVTAKNPADQTSPNTFYLGAPLKVKCRYQWGADHPEYSKATPLEIRFYSDPHPPGENGIIGYRNVGSGIAGTIHTAEIDFKTNMGGTIDVSCRVTQDGYLYQSKNSNHAGVKIQVVPQPITLKGPAITKTKADPGGMRMLSPYIKQCPTSLSATVKVDAHQLSGPQQSPADLADTQLMLYFQSAQAAGNNVVCRYATEHKDVPDLVITIKCPNASAQQGSPGVFNCTN